ncbi:MAG: ATP-binding protein [Candidatus Heimdallarchaeota archaeon]|nr:ATP-binding protein [Candidatus Heimdallarchaeota archaeon]MDH5646819.1 ATP-binding protein [Candidatus Heimdallarchaeota archaeon]
MLNLKLNKVVSDSVLNLMENIKKFESTEDLGDFLEQEIRKIIHGAHISIILLEEGQLYFPNYPVYRSKINGVHVKRGESQKTKISQQHRVLIRKHVIGKQVIIDKNVLYIPNIKEVEGYPEGIVKDFTDFGIKSAIFCPFKVLDNTYGYLTIWKPKKRLLELDEFQIDYLTLLSEQIALIIRTFTSLQTKIQKEAYYNRMINQTKDIIFSTTIDGTILDVNDAIREVLSYNPGELIGENITKLNPYSKKMLSREEILAFDPTQPYPIGQLHKNGTVKFFEFVFWLTKNEIGEEVVHAIGRDVDDKIRYENTLNSLYTAINSSSNVVVILNLEFKIEFINNKIIEYINANPTDLLSEPISAVLEVDQTADENLYSNIEDIITDIGASSTWEGEIILKGYTQNQILCSMKLSKVWIDGRVANYLLIFEDITQKRKLEKEMINVIREESIGIIAGGIAHDYNNQLAAILGNATIIKYLAETENQPDIVEAVETIEKLIDRSKRITNQLLTFAQDKKISAEVIELEKIVVDSVRFFTIGTRIKPKFHFNAPNATVMVDIGMMNQVISNLVLNAIDAMGDIPNPQLEITVDEDKENTELYTIAIKDNGIGIEEDRLGRIFDPFYTTKSHGKGLGLASTLSIVNSHGCSLNVQSKVGVGTEFTLGIRKFDGKVASSEMNNIILENQPRKILIVDDEVELANSMTTYLKSLGHQVEFTYNSSQAIIYYREDYKKGNPFDVVITDLTIKGDINGKILLERLKKINANVKVIVISAYFKETIMVKFEEHGFANRLIKPFSFKKLSETINQVCKDSNDIITNE